MLIQPGQSQIDQNVLTAHFAITRNGQRNNYDFLQLMIFSVAWDPSVEQGHPGARPSI